MSGLFVTDAAAIISPPDFDLEKFYQEFQELELCREGESLGQKYALMNWCLAHNASKKPKENDLNGVAEILGVAVQTIRRWLRDDEDDFRKMISKEIDHRLCGWEGKRLWAKMILVMIEEQNPKAMAEYRQYLDRYSSENEDNSGVDSWDSTHQKALKILEEKDKRIPRVANKYAKNKTIQ